MECFLAYVHHKNISWRGNMELKTEALVISHNHLIMRQINFQICIGHFYLLTIKLITYSTARLCLYDSSYIANMLAASIALGYIFALTQY